ncbi:MAG: MATE family efflux transporter [Lachnospiraceae bacterium]
MERAIRYRWKRFLPMCSEYLRLFSAMFCLAALFLPQQLIRLFTSDPVLIRGGADYLRVVAASYLFTSISQIYLCVLKNAGASDTEHDNQFYGGRTEYYT